MMEQTFKMVDEINQPPDFDENKWLSDDTGLMALESFPFKRSKIEVGFIETANPSVVIYIVNLLFFYNLGMLAPLHICVVLC